MSLDHWAATFFTYLKPPLNATFTISVASDNGAMVWIDDTLVVNNTGVFGAFVHPLYLLLLQFIMCCLYYRLVTTDAC